MRRAAGAVALGAVLTFLAACGGSTVTGATLAGTRAPGETVPATVAGPASGAAPTAPGATTTTTVDTSDVTLGAANQVTAPGNGAADTTAAPTTVPVVASTPPGFVRAADPAGVVSAIVPDSWRVVPLDDRTLEDLASQGGDNFPAETRRQLQAAVAQAGQYMKILAVGPPNATGGAPTLSAIVTPGVLAVSTLKAMYPQQISALKGEVVEQADITVDGRPALRVKLRLPLVQGVAESTQVLVPVDAATVIVSVAGVDGPLLDQMIAGLVVPKR